MTTVLLVGLGQVGRRAARQLAESDGVDRLLLADVGRGRAAEVADALGPVAEEVRLDDRGPFPHGVDVVVSAAGGAAEPALFERAVAAGVPAAGCSDGAVVIRSLLDLDGPARDAGVALAVGCGLAPGLADVLARHAASAFEVATEVHVARAGCAGPSCVATLEANGRGAVAEWRDGQWARHRAGSGRQLIWFPAPVGALDTHRAASGQAQLLLGALPGLKRVSARVAPGPPTRRMRVEVPGDLGLSGLPGLGALARRRRLRGGLPVSRAGRRDPDAWGAVWVEVRGRRGAAEETLVYGAVDRMAFAAGAVLALAGLWVAGVGPAPAPEPGSGGLGRLAEPVPFLAELARRGVKAAVFEGAANSGSS